MPITMLEPKTSQWKRKFALLPLYLQDTPDTVGGGGLDPKLPTIKVWLTHYERRFTGRTTSNCTSSEYQYRIPGIEKIITCWREHINSGAD